jgi:hypothetical protein
MEAKLHFNPLAIPISSEIWFNPSVAEKVAYDAGDI